MEQDEVSYDPDFRERQAASAKAKAALLEKFRTAPGPDDPQRKAREAQRRQIVEARKARAAERKAAGIAREKALADEAAREAKRREGRRGGKNSCGAKGGARCSVCSS
jgi:hypothetical protein